jgi:hypothetical protein
MASLGDAELGGQPLATRAPADSVAPSSRVPTAGTSTATSTSITLAAGARPSSAPATTRSTRRSSSRLTRAPPSAPRANWRWAGRGRASSVHQQLS